MAFTSTRFAKKQSLEELLKSSVFGKALAKQFCLALMQFSARGRLEIYLMERSELSALVSVIASPLGIFFILFLLAMVFYQIKPIFSHCILVISLACLWFFSTPLLSNLLAQLTEHGYPPQAIKDLPGVDAIVLLGGGVRGPRVPSAQAELNGAGDRIIQAYRLFAQKKAATIVAVGGQVFSEIDSLSEAEYMRDMLVELGVPLERVILEPTSRNTQENASATRALLFQSEVRESYAVNETSTFLLVTSASHMARAVYSFEKVGLSVVPATTDYRAKDALTTPFPYLPTAYALSLSSEMIREWLALLSYRIY